MRTLLLWDACIFGIHVDNMNCIDIINTIVESINFLTRDLKITHPVRLRHFRLKINGIGGRGFIQQKKVAKIRLRLVGVASFK